MSSKAPRRQRNRNARARARVAIGALCTWVALASACAHQAAQQPATEGSTAVHDEQAPPRSPHVEPTRSLPRERIAVAHAELDALGALLPLDAVLQALLPAGTAMPDVVEARTLDAAIALHAGALRTVLVFAPASASASEGAGADGCQAYQGLVVCCLGACDGFVPAVLPPTAGNALAASETVLLEARAELPESPEGDALREQLSEQVLGVLLELRAFTLTVTELAPERVRLELRARFGLAGSASTASMLLRAQIGQLAERLEELGPEAGAPELDAMRIDLDAGELHATLELAHSTLRLCAALLAKPDADASP